MYKILIFSRSLFVNSSSNNASKYSFLIFALFAAPALVCLDKLLVWWLVNVPQWAYLMTLVGILRTLNECLLLPLETSIGATGKIKGKNLLSY